MNTRNHAKKRAVEIFIGYIKVVEKNVYIEYDIKGLTRKSARLRLKKVVHALNLKNLDASYEISYVFNVDDPDAISFKNSCKIVGERKTIVCLS